MIIMIIIIIIMSMIMIMIMIKKNVGECSKARNSGGEVSKTFPFLFSFCFVVLHFCV